MNNNGKTVNQIKYVSDFKCNFNNCGKNCCSWYKTVDVEKELVELYAKEAPELFQCVKKVDHNYFMVADDNNKCVMLKDNLCQIQVKYGIKFLPEICHKYPRKFVRFNDEIYVVSTFPCSLMIKSALFTENAFSWEKVNLERLPEYITNILKNKFPNSTPAKIFNIYNSAMNMVDEPAYTSEETILRLLILGEYLDNIKKADWHIAIKSIIKLSNRNIVNELYNKNKEKIIGDEFIHHFIHSLLVIVKNSDNPEFSNIIESISEYIDKVDRNKIRETWNEYITTTHIDVIFKNYINAKLTEYMFPVGNWGSCVDDMLFITIAYSTLRLAVMANYDELEGFTNINEIIKYISVIERCFYGKKKRIYDHYTKVGWVNPDKLKTLLLNY